MAALRWFPVDAVTVKYMEERQAWLTQKGNTTRITDEALRTTLDDILANGVPPQEIVDLYIPEAARRLGDRKEQRHSVCDAYLPRSADRL